MSVYILCTSCVVVVAPFPKNGFLLVLFECAALTVVFLQFASQYEIETFYEVSAKTGENVSEAFQGFFKEIHKKVIQFPRKLETINFFLSLRPHALCLILMKLSQLLDKRVATVSTIDFLCVSTSVCVKKFILCTLILCSMASNQGFVYPRLVLKINYSL